MKTKLHAAAGAVAFLTILSFWSATTISELFADHDAVTAVKHAILWGLALLIPSMIAVGGSGMALAKGRTGGIVAGKRRRMPLIALNGLLILAPSAIFLAIKSAAGEFDTHFYTVQAVELVAGAANLALIGLSIRDGLRMTAGRRARAADRSAQR